MAERVRCAIDDLGAENVFVGNAYYLAPRS